MVRIRCRMVGVAVLALLSTTSCAAREPGSGSAVTASVATSSSSAAGALDVAGRIVFTRAGDPFGDDTVFLARADGTGEEQLSEPDHCCVRVSHDGRDILFSIGTADDRITTAVMNLDSRAVRNLPLPGTKNLSPGAWSWDGKTIAVEVYDDADPSAEGIYLVRSADGALLRRLTTGDGGGSDIPGDFSPDGRWLAFFKASQSEGHGELFIVAVDGKLKPRRLSPEGFGVGFGSIRFSPDGSKILFEDSRVSERGALWTIAPTGRNLTKVFDDPKLFATHASWSPDGTSIMFSLNPVADTHEHVPNSLAVMKADGTGVQEVIGGRDFKREVEWFE